MEAKFFDLFKDTVDGIVTFLKAFIAELKAFIDGFKKEMEFPTSSDPVDL
ncbi:MAG: hypothetical protein IJK40_07175 [Clostridia bacterium]|nr:hypothetical protein [Clostridia bacterium]MBR0537914.1 hypothetical protein [Clostridia bacterium]